MNTPTRRREGGDNEVSTGMAFGTPMAVATPMELATPMTLTRRRGEEDEASSMALTMTPRRLVEGGDNEPPSTGLEGGAKEVSSTDGTTQQEGVVIFRCWSYKECC